MITSGATGTDLAENSGAGQTIYTITAAANNDGGTIQSYAIAGTDEAQLGVDASTGVVTLTADPDYETQSFYSFTVTATNEAGTSNATTVTFSITDVDETAAAGCAPATDLTCYQVAYSATADDFGGTSVSVEVVDLYLDLPEDNDVLMTVFDLTLSIAPSSASFFQSFTGTGWIPTNVGSIFNNAAVRQLDSFVTIGGFDMSGTAPEQSPGSGTGVDLDPEFGGNTAAAPYPLAGWYNSDPSSLIGLSGDLTNVGLTGVHGVFIGRFTTTGPELSLEGSTFSVLWNQGSGPPSGFQTVTVCAAP